MFSRKIHTLLFVGILVIVLSSSIVVLAQDDSSVVTATTRGNLNVRQEPGVDGAVLGTLPPQATVDVLKRILSESNELWLLVPFEDGTAWIAGWLVDIEGNIENVPWERLAPGTEPITLSNIADLKPLTRSEFYYANNIFQFTGDFYSWYWWSERLLKDIGWLPDGRLLVGYGGRIEVRTPTGELEQTWKMPYDLSAFLVHPAGDKLAYLRQDSITRGLYLYDIETQQHIHLKTIRLNDWQNPRPLTWAWSDNGERLILATRLAQHAIFQSLIIDIPSQEILQQIEGVCIGFDETGDIVACNPGNTHSALRFYDVITGEVLERFSLQTFRLPDGTGFESFSGGDPLDCLHINPELTLAICSGSYVVSQTRSGAQMGYITVSVDLFSSNVQNLLTGSNDFYSAMNWQQHRFASPGTNEITWTDLESVAEHKLAMTGFARRLEFSADGRYLAALDEENVVHVFQIENSQLLWNSPDESDAVVSIAFSPDSQKLIQVHENQQLSVLSFAAQTVSSLGQVSLPPTGLRGNADEFLGDPLRVPALDPWGRFLAAWNVHEVRMIDPMRFQSIGGIPLDTTYWWYRALFSETGKHLVILGSTRSPSILSVRGGTVPRVYTDLVLLNLENFQQLQKRGVSGCLPVDYRAPAPFLTIDESEQVVAFSDRCKPGLILWFYGEDRSETVEIPLDYDVHFLRFTSDGILVGLGQDNAIHFFDSASGTEIRTQNTPYRPVSMLSDELMFLETPDFQYIAWDMEQETVVGELLDAYPYLLSPDGYLLVGLTGDQLVLYGIPEE